MSRSRHEYSSPRDLITAHAGYGEDERAESGFLYCLRPYRGLDVRNFCELAHAIIDVAKETRALDVKLAHDLWSTCHLARYWGVREDGPLRTNNLISESDALLLQSWIDVIEGSSLHLLEHRSFTDVAIHFLSYIMLDKPFENSEKTVELVVASLQAPNESVRETAAEASVRLGELAVRALPLLRDAVQDPSEDVRRAASRAVTAIEEQGT